MKPCRRFRSSSRKVISEAHREFRGIGLDGVYAKVARKTGSRELEIIGLVCIINDQSLTPLHLHLQLSPESDHVSWMECRLGERTESGMRRERYSSNIVRGNMLHVVKRLNSIDWFYQVGYGERAE